MASDMSFGVGERRGIIGSVCLSGHKFWLMLLSVVLIM